MISRRSLVVLLAVSLVACRLRTTYDSKATSECMTEATSGGVTDPTKVRKAFDDCCHKRGLDSVEPGSQACGHLGLDGLLK